MKITYKQFFKKLEKIADEVDEYLGECESQDKTNTKNYQAVLALNCALRNILEVDYSED